MSRPQPENLLGQSAHFLEIIERASALAQLDRPVLICGERGTGKELIAARLHYLSPRWSAPFISINCAALSDELLDSELFGHEAGAFTGAQKRHHGRFERANGGTLFLDELANASLRVQEKLLRVLEYGQMERVGGSQTLTVDVRVVAATHEDLPGRVTKGLFRADLLDRLAFDVLLLPPLRYRGDDVELLADYFARQFCDELDSLDFAGFSEEVLTQLNQHTWPGNVRELRNVIERSLFRFGELGEPLSELSLQPFDAPWHQTEASDTQAEVSETQTGPVEDFHGQTRAFEIKLLRKALVQNNYAYNKTASQLGLTYHQLRALLRKYDLYKQKA